MTVMAFDSWCVLQASLIKARLEQSEMVYKSRQIMERITL